MSQEIFFTLDDYEQNYERLKKEFVDAYIDNDEEVFISLQVEWYEKCLENTILEYGIIADSIGWETKALRSHKGIVGVVDKKIRNDRGWINKETAQNLNVSFKKILKFLKEELNTPKPKNNAELKAVQAMLYHFVLQDAKIEPKFLPGSKGKALDKLSSRYGLSQTNLKNKYNLLLTSDGKKGYTKDDAIKVRDLLMISHPTALNSFEVMTKHILF